MNDLVSVIVPVYKVEPYIRQALNSVINQTYRNLQIILVDDGSPDNCGAICDEYAQNDSRIIVIHKENGGVSSARNAGINASTGEWLYFMDPDDWIEPETLEVCLGTATEMNTDLVAFSYDRFNVKKTWIPNDQRLIKLEAARLYDVLDYDAIFMYRLSAGSCTFVVRTSLIKGSILFDNDLQAYEDIYFNYLLWQNIQSFCRIPNILYHYRVRLDSTTTKCDFRKLYDDNMISHKKLHNLFETGNYPEGTELMERTRFVSKMIGFLTGALIDDPTLSFREKKEAIYNVVGMEDFQIVLNENEPRVLGMAGIIFFLLHRCPVVAVYVIYCLKKLKQFLPLT